MAKDTTEPEAAPAPPAVKEKPEATKEVPCAPGTFGGPVKPA